MPTPGENRGVGAAAKEVADHAKALVALELELAGVELKRKAGAFGAGAMLGVTAAVLGLFALGFAFAAAGAALATVMATWLALLIVAAALLVFAGILGAVALAAIRRATPPMPEQALEEARRTTEVLRSNGR
jgi:uncharacterized membrane protein YqjE